MPKKNSYITVTDQFCGAGGSSQGARKAGVEVKLALNHWQLAIETHNTNFPDTLHDCTDISACDPRRYPSTDILITSPECTNHTLAKGQKAVKAQLDLFKKGKLDPAAERSRATMFDVCRFAEFHQYNVIIVENVVEARKWVMWDGWLKCMYALGYQHQCVYINSMHCIPTPQSRDRMYVVFWKKGNPKPNLDFTPLAHCPKCSKDVHSVQSWKNPAKPWGKYRQQYVYRCPVDGLVVEPYYYASFNIIDWTDLGQRIGDRKKPLKPTTIDRIQNGLDRFHEDAFVVLNYSPGYSKSITDALSSITTKDHHGIVRQPFIINNQHSTGIDFRVKSSADPLQTLTTSHGLRLITQPMLIKQEHTKSKGYVRKISDPMMGQTTSHSTGICTPEAFKSFISYYYSGSNQASHVHEVLDTVTTADRMALVSGEQPRVEDCFYRMLKPREVKLGMAFEPDYVILGTGADQVRQCGNAVTPPVMEWLVNRGKESLN